jgi:hypothetical protein
MRAALANLGEGDFTEGHELDPKWKVPKEMVGRRLSQAEVENREAGVYSASREGCMRFLI